MLPRERKKASPWLREIPASHGLAFFLCARTWRHDGGENCRLRYLLKNSA